MSPYTDRVTECTSASVLCERPTTTREPIHTGALLAVMGIGLFALVIAVIWRHLERRADRGEQ